MEGLENLPPLGQGALLASNHASVLDPVLIGSAIPDRRIQYLAKKELFGPPFWSRLLPRLGAFPVDRGAVGPGSIRRMMDVLDSGESLLIFPEGTRTRTGDLLPGKRGAGYMALNLGAPVIPVRVLGSFGVLSAGRILPRFSRGLRVVFGRVLDFKDLQGTGEARETQQRASDRIMDAIRALPL